MALALTHIIGEGADIIEKRHPFRKITLTVTDIEINDGKISVVLTATYNKNKKNSCTTKIWLEDNDEFQRFAPEIDPSIIVGIGRNYISSVLDRGIVLRYVARNYKVLNRKSKR